MQPGSSNCNQVKSRTCNYGTSSAPHATCGWWCWWAAMRRRSDGGRRLDTPWARGRWDGLRSAPLRPLLAVRVCPYTPSVPRLCLSTSAASSAASSAAEPSRVHMRAALQACNRAVNRGLLTGWCADSPLSSTPRSVKAVAYSRETQARHLPRLVPAVQLCGPIGRRETPASSLAADAESQQ